MLSSLDILNPAPWAGTKQLEGTSDDTKMLEALSVTMIRSAAAQDWEHEIWQRLSANFVGEFSYGTTEEPVRNWKTFVAHHRAVRQQYPDYHFEIVDICIDVHERNGTASVYIMLKVTGHPSTLERASVLVLRWRRNGESWLCYREGVIRGVRWYL